MVRYCLSLLATLAATANLVQGQFVTKTSPLNAIDILLDAPIGAQSCRPSQITWSWDRVGALPGDPIALSLINATDLASFLSSTSTSISRRRAATGNYHDARNHRLQLQRRAQVKGVQIQGAESVAFSATSYSWPQVKAFAGQYRLVLTIVESGQAVVSDPFTITGSDISCLTSTAASATSQTGSTNPSQTSSSSSVPSSQKGASSSTPVQGSSIQTLGSQPAGSANATPSASGSSDDSSGGSKSNGGAIAAGVIVPLLAIAAAIIGWFWYRKRQNRAGSAGGSSAPWTEKFTGAGGAAAGGFRNIGSGLARKDSKHTRGISGPQAATSAGLAAVASMVPMELRQEKDHAALQGSLDYQNGGHHDLRRGSPDQLQSPTDGQWMSFAEDDAHNVVGARPLSRDTIDSAHIGDYRSIGVPSSSDGNSPMADASGLYAQGRNVPLGSQSFSSVRADSISTFGTPADPRASNMTQGSLGRDLIAALPRPPPSSPGQRSTSRPGSLENISPFADSAAGSNLEAEDGHHHTTDSEPHDADLVRADSTGSTFGIKRKPVPRLTVAGPPKTQDSNISSNNNDDSSVPSIPDEVDTAAQPSSSDPFSDQHNILPSRFSTSHDEAYDADAFEPEHVEEVGAHPDNSPVIPGTPSRGQPSVPSTPASAVHPVDHSSSSPSEHDQAAKEQYHLSMNFAQDNSFRVSFGQS